MPVLLSSLSDYSLMLVLTMFSGAVGALAAELLIARGHGHNTGALERPRRLEKPFYDLGSFAAIPLGLVAALIALLLFSPIQDVTNGGRVAHQYDLYKLIGLALVAGLSSQTFLRAIQERFTSLATTERLNSALTSADAALAHFEHADIGKEAGAAAQAGASHVARVVDEATSRTPNALMQWLKYSNLLDQEDRFVSSPLRAGNKGKHGSVVEGSGDYLKREFEPEERSQLIEQAVGAVSSEVTASIQHSIQAQAGLARRMIAEARKG